MNKDWPASRGYIGSGLKIAKLKLMNHIQKNKLAIGLKKEPNGEE